MEYNNGIMIRTKGSTMKVRLHILCLLLLLLLPFAAVAEITLELSAEEVALFCPVDFTLSGDADHYRYTLAKDGKTLFEAETQRPFGSYLPRETGEYTLMAASGDETAEAVFTVVDALSVQLGDVPSAIRTGEPLKVLAQAEGGAGEKQYVYTIASEGRTVHRAGAGAEWLWVPAEAGQYTLHVQVLDEGGAQAKTSVDFAVEEGAGISVEAAGGDLGAHGGQKSWIVYAADAWTAQTDADFLTLETVEGQSGDVLTVTVQTQTDEYREGIIRLLSGAHQLELTAAQSAGFGVDEEVSLFAADPPVYADGQTHAVWTGAQGSRSFRVDAQGEWRAACDADFIHFEQTEDGLKLTVEEAESSAVRSGVVTLSCGSSTAYIHVYQQPAVRMQAQETTADDLPALDSFTLHSQSSGLWQNKKYGASNLQKSGCAIFALSHALQCLGYEGEAITPEALAKKYAFCLREDGTINSTLVGNAGDDLGFKTRYDLYHDVRSMRGKRQDGAVFSFAVVNGHIAMIADVSADGSMVKVIDSAPSATWERIGEHRLYIEKDGSFVPVEDLADIPGIRFYPETDAFGGAVYWLESDYAARRGVRLIQPRP